MRLITAAAAVLNQTPLDWANNLAHCLEVLAKAREAGVSLVCMPELCLTGYGCEDAFHAANTHQRAWQGLRALEPETKGLVVAVGLPVMHQNAVFNVAALLVDGKIVGLSAKRHLAGDGIHYEPRWFKAWPIGIRDVFRCPDSGERLPIGDLSFEVGGIRLGFEICEDAWVAERPGARLARHGVDIILNPSASHFAFGKMEVRRRFVLEGSRAFNCSYIYANLLGNESGRAIYDGGTLIAAGGHLMAEGPRFSFKDSLLTTATLDIDLTRMNQARTASFQPDLSGDDPLVVHAEFTWPRVQVREAKSGKARPQASPWEHRDCLKEEEFARAEALALFDYMRKSRSHGFVLSLSGGADSAAIACLSRLMLELALEDIGSAGLAKKLAYFRRYLASSEAKQPMQALLLTAYQATRNSGAVTRHAAKVVAEAVGAEHHELNIAALHEGYVAMIEKALDRPLTWEADDIALQNIQARVRSPGIWMFANIRGGLLISTSNRSEAAVGYATMDGDTSGGLSPIAGIDKAWLRHWLRWLEKDGPLIHGKPFSIPALHAVNEQQPTAELRPAEKTQTDEADLMPYPLLDAIERAAIRDKQAPAECLELMANQFPHYSREQLLIWTERFFRLWSRNQWKRERYAPSFHLDDENLDPKTWCRWPILSGGFEAELAELRKS